MSFYFYTQTINACKCLCYGCCVVCMRTNKLCFKTIYFFFSFHSAYFFSYSNKCLRFTWFDISYSGLFVIVRFFLFFLRSYFMSLSTKIEKNLMNSITKRIISFLLFKHFIFVLTDDTRKSFSVFLSFHSFVPSTIIVACWQVPLMKKHWKQSTEIDEKPIDIVWLWQKLVKYHEKKKTLDVMDEKEIIFSSIYSN